MTTLIRIQRDVGIDGFHVRQELFGHEHRFTLGERDCFVRLPDLNEQEVQDFWHLAYRKSQYQIDAPDSPDTTWYAVNFIECGFRESITGNAVSEIDYLRNPSPHNEKWTALDSLARTLIPKISECWARAASWVCQDGLIELQEYKASQGWVASTDVFVEGSAERLNPLSSMAINLKRALNVSQDVWNEIGAALQGGGGNTSLVQISLGRAKRAITVRTHKGHNFLRHSL